MLKLLELIDFKDKIMEQKTPGFFVYFLPLIFLLVGIDLTF